jgi:hypothetical protein
VVPVGAIVPVGAVVPGGAVVADGAVVPADADVSDEAFLSLPHATSKMLRTASEVRVLREILGVIIDLQFTDGVAART